MADFDYCQSVEKDTLEQFRDKPNIQVLHDVLAKQLQDVYAFFQQLKSDRHLDSAIGKQLDGIGDIVCLSREKAGEYAGMFPSGTIGDEEYRALLKSKIIINTNDATYYGIIKSIRSLYGTFPVYYSEDPELPATMILELDAAGAGDVTPLGFIPPVKAAGVGILWLYTIRAIIEVHGEVQTVPYSMPPCNTLYCGTFPCRATLGWTASTQIECSIRLDDLRYLTRFCGTYPNIATVGWIEKALATAGFTLEHIKNGGKLCGTDPEVATPGKVFRFIIAVPGEVSGHPFDPLTAGKDECGTIPSVPTIAQRIEAVIRSNPALTDIAAIPPFTNTERAGVYPGRS